MKYNTTQDRHPTLRFEDMPAQDRPYEKCLSHGCGSLSDRELLANILRCGIPGINSLEVADRLLAAAGETSANGLCGLMQLSLPELRKIAGIGKVRAMQLQCIGELSRRIAAAQARPRLSFTDPSSIALYYMEQLRHEPQEMLMAMMLDSKMHLLSESMLSKGTVNASLITPREVFVEALRIGAVSLILVHNHPSGDPTPSRSDLELTRRVRLAGEMVGIDLTDHIIIGDKDWVSLHQEGFFCLDMSQEF